MGIVFETVMPSTSTMTFKQTTSSKETTSIHPSPYSATTTSYPPSHSPLFANHPLNPLRSTASTKSLIIIGIIIVPARPAKP